MEYAKDELFNVKYNALEGEVIYKTNRKNKFIEKLKKNYFINSVILLGIIFFIINCLLIYNFANLLGEI